MVNRQNGHRHLDALHILYHQQSTAVDRLFIEIRQWKAAEGEHSDLVVEHGGTVDPSLSHNGYAWAAWLGDYLPAQGSAPAAGDSSG